MANLGGQQWQADISLQAINGYYFPRVMLRDLLVLLTQLQILTGLICIKESVPGRRQQLNAALIGFIFFRLRHM